MRNSEIRLECLKMVWPQGGNPEPAHYIAKAEALLTWVLSGGDTGISDAAPTNQTDQRGAKPGTLRKAPSTQ